MSGEHFHDEAGAAEHATESPHHGDTQHLGDTTGTENPLFAPEHVSYGPGAVPELGPAPSAGAIGEPVADAVDWQYQGPVSGLCAPASIAMVVNEFGLEPAGVPLTAEQVAQWALPAGDMSPDGHPVSASDFGYNMGPQQVQVALAHYGVPSQVVTGGSLSMLENYLSSGREVILGVDGDRIWHDIPSSSDPGRANHALVLTGIDQRTGYAYLNDSGSPYGKEEAVPIADLMSAWSGSDYTAIVSDYVPSAHEPAMPAFQTPGTETLPVSSPAGSTPTTGATTGAVILPAVLHRDAFRLRDEIEAATDAIGHAATGVAGEVEQLIDDVQP